MSAISSRPDERFNEFERRMRDLEARITQGQITLGEIQRSLFPQRRLEWDLVKVRMYAFLSIDDLVKMTRVSKQYALSASRSPQWENYVRVQDPRQYTELSRLGFKEWSKVGRKILAFQKLDSKCDKIFKTQEYLRDVLVIKSAILVTGLLMSISPDVPLEYHSSF